MGTFKRPPPNEWPMEYGVMKLETVLRGLWAQTWMPFRAKKLYERFVGQDEIR